MSVDTHDTHKTCTDELAKIFAMCDLPSLHVSSTVARGTRGAMGEIFPTLHLPRSSFNVTCLMFKPRKGLEHVRFNRPSKR